jgi:hypothetical protein
VSDEIGRLAYVVLRTVNRMQAKGSTVRIVAPRDPEVAHELGMDTDEDVILTAVEHLLEQGYVVPAGLDRRGSNPHPSLAPQSADSCFRMLLIVAESAYLRR